LPQSGREYSLDRTIVKKQNHDLKDEYNYSSYCMLAPHDWNKVEILYNETLKTLIYLMEQVQKFRIQCESVPGPGGDR